MNDARIEAAVLAALASLNETLPAAHQVPLRRDATLANLESLAITNLIVAVEDVAREQLELELTLTDEQTLALLEDKERTPMRTVDTLVTYVAALVARSGA